MATSTVPQGEQVHVDLAPAATLAAYARHRRRFAAEVESFDAAALSVQSRCSEWSVADVLRHGCDVDGWIQAIWTGKSLPFSNFDPLTTPHEFVLAGRAISDTEARDRFLVSAETMAADVGAAEPETWGSPAFSPLGPVPWWLSALHVFYDSWLHERDALLPLRIVPPVERDEATPVLAYSLALVGMLIDKPIDTVVAGVHLIAGSSPVVAAPSEPASQSDDDIASIIDALSGRGSVDDALDGTDPDIVRRLGALARFFRPSA